MKEFLMGISLKTLPQLSTSVLLPLPSLLWIYILNWNEVRIESLSASLGIITFTAIVLYLSTYVATRDLGVSIIVASILNFAIFSFGSWTKFLYQNPLLINTFHIRAEKAVIIVMAILIAVITITIAKYPSHKMRFTNTLFVIGFVLTLIPLSLIINNEVRRPSIISKQTDIEFSSVSTSNSPDIYYVIIERYASFKTLKERYALESDLKPFLEKEGFYIADDSKPNYPHTSLSLTSSLNLSYLNWLGNISKQLKGDKTHLFASIDDNVLFSYLKRNNYQIIQLGDNWQGTENNHRADINYNYYAPLNAFTRLFLENTILDFFYKKYIYTTKTKIEWYKIQKIESGNFKLNKLKEIVKMPNKKIVFAHMLITHEPYVLNKKGIPLTDEQIARTSQEDRYINHIRYGNIIMKKLVNVIKKNKRPYVLIIQADEGPYTNELRKSVDEGDFSWSKVSSDAIKTHMSILNAYYFPNKSDYKSLYKSISPVNSFRVVLNTYFDQKLPILKDKYFLNQDFENLYQFKIANLGPSD